MPGYKNGYSGKALHLLLCRPKYFGIYYEINPWMSLTRSANGATALAQWKQLCQTLKQTGARLHFIAPRPGLPDMVFVANAGSIIKDQFILSRFRWPQRRGEEPFYCDYVKQLSQRVVPLSGDAFFEGEGDLLSVGRHYFAGYGIRSDAKAYEEISRKTKVPIELLRLVHPRFYHLDTCFFPLDDQSVLYYPPAFDAVSQEKIKRLIPDPVAVGRRDAFSFACNGIRIGREVIVHQATRSLKAALLERGLTTHEVPVGEFLKAGGSVKCMVLKFFDSEA